MGKRRIRGRSRWLPRSTRSHGQPSFFPLVLFFFFFVNPRPSSRSAVPHTMLPREPPAGQSSCRWSRLAVLAPRWATIAAPNPLHFASKAITSSSVVLARFPLLRTDSYDIVSFGLCNRPDAPIGRLRAFLCALSAAFPHPSQLGKVPRRGWVGQNASLLHVRQSRFLSFPKILLAQQGSHGGRPFRRPA